MARAANSLYTERLSEIMSGSSLFIDAGSFVAENTERTCDSFEVHVQTDCDDPLCSFADHNNDSVEDAAGWSHIELVIDLPAETKLLQCVVSDLPAILSTTCDTLRRDAELCDVTFSNRHDRNMRSTDLFCDCAR